MDNLNFLYRDDCSVDAGEIESLLKMLCPEIIHITQERACQYDSQYAPLYLPDDVDLSSQIQALVAKKKKLQPKILIVIGIGGSNLGTKAVQEALQNRSDENQPAVLYADTIDPDMIARLLQKTENVLKQGNAILLNIISKSGSTTETIVNASLFIELLKQYRPHDYQHYIVVTTEQDNKLWRFANEEGFDTLPIPAHIGGRYSVLSAVGLFPLALMNIDIQSLITGAASMMKRCQREDNENYAAVSATLLYALYHKGFVIHDFFSFSTDLYGLGMWYRQLIAESIGKEYARDGKRVQVGITPIVSVGSTDLHSMVELHLGGPPNTVTTFVSVKQNNMNILAPCSQMIKLIIPFASNKSLATIMDAMMQGAQYAYRTKQLPFTTIIFPQKSAWFVGQFIQWKLYEIVYLGYLFGINPFIQPQVELYKKETKAILNHE